MDRCLIARFTIVFFVFKYSVSLAQYYVPGTGNSGATANTPRYKSGFDREKLVPGGIFSTGLSRNIFALEISPSLAYQVHERVLPGIIFTNLYMQGRISRLDPNTGLRYTDRLQLYTFGLSLFTRVSVTKSIFLHGELGGFRGQVFRFDASRNFLGLQNQFAIFPMLGGGFLLPIGERSAFLAMLLYNLRYIPNFSIYGDSPFIIRLGFAF